jgi:SAM-dependent methyltransferase
MIQPFQPSQMMPEPEWLTLNRANWDERVPIHLAAGSYDLTDLRAGRGRLHSIEAAELGSVAGLRLLHLQCHFGRDSLTLAQLGADVTGLDFSGPAIAAARKLAAELGLTARFVQSDVYSARDAVEGRFDRLYVTWGTICWLPDIIGWAKVIASLLAPAGELYFADAHPAAYVFDDETAVAGMPGWYAPYFHQGVLQVDDERDYADATVRLTNLRTHQFMHPIASVITALMDAGLQLTMLHEHDSVPWQMFSCLVEDGAENFRWPDRPWLPLSFSLKAARPLA